MKFGCSLMAIIGLTVFCSAAYADPDMTNNQQTTAQKAAEKADKYIRSIVDAPTTPSNNIQQQLLNHLNKTIQQNQVVQSTQPTVTVHPVAHVGQ